MFMSGDIVLVISDVDAQDRPLYQLDLQIGFKPWVIVGIVRGREIHQAGGINQAVNSVNLCNTSKIWWFRDEQLVRLERIDSCAQLTKKFTHIY